MQVRQRCCALILSLVCLLVLAATLWAGEAVLSWEPPAVNEDGSPLDDLAGYRIHYGRVSIGRIIGENDADPENFQYEYTEPAGTGLIPAGTTTFTVTGLQEGVWYYFAVTAIDDDNNQSFYSREASKFMEPTPPPPGGDGLVTVYIAYDARATTLPAWLSAYTPTGLALNTTDTSLEVFQQAVPVGLIELPGNQYGNPVGVDSNYIVLLDLPGGDTITDVMPSNYRVVNLQVGDTYYIDRSYTITGMPGNLQGLTAIQTANNDKGNTQAVYLTFTVNQGAPPPSLPTIIGFLADDMSPTVNQGAPPPSPPPPSEPPPIASFGATPTSGPAPLNVEFTDTSSGTITSWNWDFNEGNTSTAQDPTHIFTDVGSSLVNLTVDGPGGASTATETITVTVPSGGNPSDLITVYIAYDARATTLPAWLSAYTPTGLVLNTTDTSLEVFQQDIPAGLIELPGNQYGNPVGVDSNYIVLLDLPGGSTITNMTPSNYRVANVQVGDTYYIDRSYTITGMPGNLQELTAIQTANNDKGDTQVVSLTFTVTVN